jgi:ectoine hydroxylase-related dioxygenase (phytanoyl-CoA dioxygenase family)
MDDLERDGYVVLEDALARLEVARLTQAVDRVWRERRPDGTALHELSFLGLDDAFVELVDHSRLLPLVVEALGWNVYVYHCHLDVHPPAPPDGAWRWHQDGGRQNVDLPPPRPRLSVKAAYFLTDVRCPDDGAFWLVPGSHRHDRLERPADGSPRPPGARPLLVRAGTAVLFDRRLWHARGDNTGLDTRKALFLAYTHRWVRPRDEPSLDPARIAALSPVRRQLLGWGSGTLGHWLPTEDDAPLRAAVR